MTNEIFYLEFKEQGSHPHPSSTSDNEHIFEHVLVELLPQLDMKPYFFEEKRKPESNHLPLKKRLVWQGGSATTRTNHMTPPSKCATHDFICAAPTYDCAKPAYDCENSTYDYAKSAYECAAPACNAQCSNPPFAPTSKLNNKADAD